MPAYTFTIPNLPGSMTVTCTSESQKDAIKEAHFWQSLPTVCPIDGTPTIFCFREPADNAYYSVISTGFPVYEYKIGQHRTGGTLFAKEEWVLFDGSSETVLWSRGKLTPAGEKARSSHGKGQEHRATITPPPVAPPVENKTAPTPPPTSQNGNGNGSKSQNGNTTRPDIYTQRAEAIYAHNAQIALAALCRQASGGKRSALTELDATQLVALDTSLVLRMELHAAGTGKYGDGWNTALQKAVRGRNELYDLDAELNDEAIRQMIAAIQKK